MAKHSYAWSLSIEEEYQCLEECLRIRIVGMECHAAEKHLTPR
jgi:hypothetical protein